MADIMGGPASPTVAPKGKRVLAGLFDLVLVPIIIGLIAGLILYAAPNWLRVAVLVIVNIAWLLVRDTVWSPGRLLAGTRLLSEDGQAVSLGQAFIRNILLIIPFVLVVGYIIEFIALLATGNRLADRWAKTKTVLA